MLQLLGARFPIGPEQTVKDRVRAGHAFLVRITGQDFGLDPDRWHAHLITTNAGGYKWSNKHLGMPARIRQAVADPEWQRAVAELRSG